MVIKILIKAAPPLICYQLFLARHFQSNELTNVTRIIRSKAFIITYIASLYLRI